MCLVCKRDNIWLPLQTTKRPAVPRSDVGSSGPESFVLSAHRLYKCESRQSLKSHNSLLCLRRVHWQTALRYATHPQSKQGRDSQPVMKTPPRISTGFVSPYCLRPKPAQPELAVKSPSIWWRRLNEYAIRVMFISPPASSGPQVNVKQSSGVVVVLPVTRRPLQSVYMQISGMRFQGPQMASWRWGVRGLAGHWGTTTPRFRVLKFLQIITVSFLLISRIISPCDPTADDRLYHICITAVSVSI